MGTKCEKCGGYFNRHGEWKCEDDAPHVCTADGKCANCGHVQQNVFRTLWESLYRRSTEDLARLRERARELVKAARQGEHQLRYARQTTRKQTAHLGGPDPLGFMRDSRRLLKAANDFEKN